MLVIEFEPRVIGEVQGAFERALLVGALATTLLLAVAVSLARAMNARAELERRAERERRLVALGQMSSVMAHELRNPLASLKGHAQLLAEGLPQGTRDHTKAERVVLEAERIERLTEDLLAFVRDSPLDRRKLDPRELVMRTVETTGEGRVYVDASAAPLWVSVDEARIARALANLVRNALQASDEGMVEVRITGADGGFTIEVCDEGPGLPPGEEERIFEPFMTHRVRGTGLGLAVARRAVEQHGGTLVGENRPEGGAVFRITLPST